MSTFSGLNTALTSLYAQRRGLDITGQNIANANTEGYSRQRVELQSVGAPAVPAMWSTYGGSAGGVTVSGVQRLRDNFLEARASTEQAKLSNLAGGQETLAGIERVFQEPGKTGLQSQLSDMWGAWGDVANQPTNEAARSAILQKTETVADSLRQANGTLEAQWSATREQLVTTVADVNANAVTIGELNQAILTASQAGIPSNELADQRDQLVLGLANKVGATSKARENGTVDVYLGGTALVRGNRADTLAVAGPTTLSAERAAAGKPVTVEWAVSGTPAQTGGTSGSYVASLTTTIPNFAGSLDTIAKSIVDTVNAAHTTGYDLDGNSSNNMFSGTKAADIKVLITDPRKVAASAEGPTPGVPPLGGVPSSDSRNAAALAGIGVKVDGPDSTYRTMIVNLGSLARTANSRLAIQTQVADQIDGARDAAAGVNLDEEMVNLLSYQRGYEAAARVMTTVDATLDTLINRTGLVGR